MSFPLNMVKLDIFFLVTGSYDCNFEKLCLKQIENVNSKYYLLKLRTYYFFY